MKPPVACETSSNFFAGGLPMAGPAISGRSRMEGLADVSSGMTS